MSREELEELLEESLDILRRAGFIAETISYPENKRSIDIVSANDKYRLLVKITVNTRELSSIECIDLKKAAKAYSATPLIVSRLDDKQEMEDDVVIKKSGINTVTTTLLRNYLLSREKPLVFKERGAYLVKIDPKEFRRKRIKYNYSFGALALELGVSRRAVYGYERGTTAVTVDTAIKIAEILGEEVLKPIDILSYEASKGSVSDEPITRVEKALTRLCTSREECEFYKLVKTPIDYVIRTEKSILSIVFKRESDREFKFKIREAMRIAQIIRSREYVIRDKKDIDTLQKLIGF